MQSKAEYLQSVVKDYQESGEHWPATTREIAKWAIARGMWKPHPDLVETQCASELSDALREEWAVDPQGRKIRTKHCAIDPRHPEQGVLWDDIRTASYTHMKNAFEARRQQILGDCKQLSLDVDSYNENRDPKQPIQMSFDFTMDLTYKKYDKNKPSHSHLH